MSDLRQRQILDLVKGGVEFDDDLLKAKYKRRWKKDGKWQYEYETPKGPKGASVTPPDTRTILRHFEDIMSTGGRNVPAGHLTWLQDRGLVENGRLTPKARRQMTRLGHVAPE